MCLRRLLRVRGAAAKGRRRLASKAFIDPEFSRANAARIDPAARGVEPTPFTFAEAEEARGTASARPLLEDAWVSEPEGGASRGTLVWLHGFGEERDRAPLVFQMVSAPGVRVVVPRAPPLPVTALGEREEAAWFDLFETDLAAEPDHDEDERGLDAMAGRVHELLDEEARRAGGAGRVMLGGFAQGAAMALHAGLLYPRGPLAGVCAVAGWAPMCTLRPDGAPPPPPVLAFHGARDSVVPWAYADERYRRLREEEGVQVEVHKRVGVGHALEPEVLMGVMGWWEARR